MGNYENSILRRLEVRDQTTPAVDSLYMRGTNGDLVNSRSMQFGVFGLLVAKTVMPDAQKPDEG